MPIYDLHPHEGCPGREAFCKVAEVTDTHAPCDDCGEMVPRVTVYAVAFTGEFHTASSMVHDPQLGTFGSYREMEKAAEEQGLEWGSSQDSKVEAFEAADTWAQKQGYSDLRDFQSKMADGSDHHRDSVAAARETKIKKQVDAWGSHVKISADDADTWKNNPLPGEKIQVGATGS